MESNEPLAQSAPAQTSGAMLAGLHARLDAYRQARASTFTLMELETALRDPRWEVRCAAAEHLDASSPRALVELAFDDEDDSVRQAAVRGLGRIGASAPIELFQKTLHDSAWQVREMALLTVRESGIALPEALLEEALHDESEPVRQAARVARAQMTRAQDTPSLSRAVLKVGERKTPVMSQQTDAPLMTPAPSSATRRRRFSPVKTLALVATLLVTVGVLTAAGFGLGWWLPLLGDPAQYTTIGQEQTANGVTVRLLRVYLDQGRSIVVYDILSPSADQRYVDGGTSLTSAYPQKNPGALPGGGVVKIDQGDARLTHEFTTYHPFATPADVSTLTVTWRIDVIQPNETLPKTAPQPLSFNFTFTAPFQQVNNQHIADPIKTGA
jgi:HEAT repeats